MPVVLRPELTPTPRVNIIERVGAISMADEHFAITYAATPRLGITIHRDALGIAANHTSQKRGGIGVMEFGIMIARNEHPPPTAIDKALQRLDGRAFDNLKRLSLKWA